MLKTLKNSRILLGVTGSVAAYKAIDLIRRLKQEGASVAVIMTDASLNFVTPLSLELASGSKVSKDLMADPMAHISLPQNADIMILAPATANTIAKAANGIADDLLSTAFLAFRGKVIIAPAMNWRMYENPAFQRNLNLLMSQDFVSVVPPERGLLACGEEGIGRLADIEKIIEAVKAAISKKDLLAEKILITAGPTREYIDPVRFISNRSTGKMGYAIAHAAKRRGAEVTLISGPSALQPPEGVSFIPIETAKQMRDSVFQHLPEITAVIMTAAVADFSPGRRHPEKLDKTPFSLRLKPVPDILGEIGSMDQRPLLIGFAAEAGNKVKRARKKLIDKGLDMIVFNNIALPSSGFGTDTNKVVLIEKGKEEDIPLMTKNEVAEIILDRLASLRNG